MTAIDDSNKIMEVSKEKPQGKVFYGELLK